MKTYYIRRRYLLLLILLPLMLCLLLLLQDWRPGREALSMPLVGLTVVVDAGHGGADPGVVGVSGVLEKDINLAVAQKLAALLENAGATVIMTRDADLFLGENKRGDLQARVDAAAGADLLISVHGNSFPQQSSSCGAQVFYASNNAAGERLAVALQKCLAAVSADGHRQALPHASSYLLKHCSCPAVVAEVGFLSNAAEERQLTDDAYQWQLAWAMLEGIVAYRQDGSAENAVGNQEYL
ncbi:MAG: N-acetylmuramoyl-L-alanine amidase [Firmicutes bacterium]|nr:N-acetylmuramoyl-L-alanine amidase [Bacillota bacterium]